ncbi:hypothetical protein BKA70DRAFT_1540113 [Coprinopsis sp. MPI-PUGE-AT-0042]|nr:hypothetical protein BKA70DRAFT_1540113 [Coprinopsis sp. MPI-PUGE-AT-0042]
MAHRKKVVSKEPRLPTEIMVEVLHFFIMSLPARDVRKERHNLSLVCPSWQRLVHSTPSMWHRIYFDPRDLPTIPDRHLESVLDLWISKAAQLPLELEGRFTYTWRGPSNDLVKVVRASSSKWKSLMLDGFHPLDFALDCRTLRALYTKYTPVAWDQLETITMLNTIHESWQLDGISSILPRPVMPRLHSLTINSDRNSLLHYLPILPFNQLRYLKLVDAWSGSLGTVLRACTRMEECVVLYSRGSVEHGPPSVEGEIPAYLGHLRCLKIHYYFTARMLEDALRPIIFPSLCELDIRFGRRGCQSPNSPSTTLLRKKIIQSHCSKLTTLTLWNPGGAQEDLLYLLMAVPSLKKVDLSLSFSELDFLAKCNTQKAIPALESVRVETLAVLWPTTSMGKQQKEKLTGRDLAKLKHQQTQFNKFTSERGYKWVSRSSFATSTWSTQVVQAELVLTTEFS